MQKFTWSEVAPSNGGSKSLPSGAYVLMVTGVRDVPSREYLEVTWDVFEGAHKGHFSDEFGTKNEWAHTFRVSYKEKARGLFRWFLDCLEKSNPSFNVETWEATSDERAFVGKLFGAAVGTEHYVRDGKKRTRFTFPDYYPIDDVRDGKAKVPEDTYSDDWNEEASTAAPAEASTAQPDLCSDDIPF